MDRTHIFSEITERMFNTYEAKNADYGNSFAKLRTKYPNQVLIRLNDKLLRLETLMGQMYVAQVNESIEDTLMDLANYCILELIERKIDDDF